MAQAPEDDGLPPSVRLLKWLVIVLTAVMIVGLIIIVAVIVIRLPQSGGPSAGLSSSLALPETLTLPEGTSPVAVTFGQGWVAIVTTNDRIMVFDSVTGALRQEVVITPLEE
jgi:hypothetical protein